MELYQMYGKGQNRKVELQDLDANIMIEMDYVPVNNYLFHVVCIGENGIKTQGRPCKNVEQAVRQFLANIS